MEPATVKRAFGSRLHLGFRSKTPTNSKIPKKFNFWILAENKKYHAIYDKIIYQFFFKFENLRYFAQSILWDKKKGKKNISELLKIIINRVDRCNQLYFYLFLGQCPNKIYTIFYYFLYSHLKKSESLKRCRSLQNYTFF